MSASGAGQFAGQAVDAATQTAWKRAAAEAAVREVPDLPDGAIVGLGSGSTADWGRARCSSWSGSSLVLEGHSIV